MPMLLNDIQKKAFLFYALMFCVDFMGERGWQFVDKFVEVNVYHWQTECLYDMLWAEWKSFEIVLGDYKNEYAKFDGTIINWVQL